ncbi:glycosyltransferase [Emticicia fluvialis]|uniref:glycosyltransferase n=1 Tax=Emticicia fluvialis TaxID=2974474 RepID=UPI002165610A|nr:glycosyltransferase [Emticicia fluvialis]
MNLAPLVLFTFKRIDTLKECIKSLKSCNLSDESELIIFSDAPRNEADIEKVNLVRTFVESINGFKKIELNFREKNYGVDYNIIEGITEISSRFDQFIILEDDLVFDKNFIYFMNLTLNYYKDYKDVISISAFSYLNNIPKDYKYDVYFTKRSWSWGWGSWSDKIRSVDWEIKDSKEFLSNFKTQYKFNEWGSDLSHMLKNTLSGKTRAWDIRLFYYQFKHNLYTIYPTSSLVLNTGFGENASNTFGFNRYQGRIGLNNEDKPIYTLPEEIIIDPVIKRSYIFRNSIPMRAMTKIMDFLKRLKVLN